MHARFCSIFRKDALFLYFHGMKKNSSRQIIAAWAVHLFTASGVIFAFLAILSIQEHDFLKTVIWLLIAQFIDGIDGTLARAAKVQEVLPNFSGDSIDHVIDFSTYAIIPAYFIYEANLLPPNLALVGISILLLASFYYYGKSTYVTKDLHFEGFPVLWNFVAFYMYFVFSLSPMGNFIGIIILSILHFLPWKYPYPSRTKEFRALTFIVLIACTLIFLWAIFQYPIKAQWVAIAGYICAIYFFGMTIYKTFFWKSWAE